MGAEIVEIDGSSAFVILAAIKDEIEVAEFAGGELVQIDFDVVFARFQGIGKYCRILGIINIGVGEADWDVIFHRVVEIRLKIIAIGEVTLLEIALVREYGHDWIEFPEILASADDFHLHGFLAVGHEIFTAY